jgi:hypothetical protein
MILDLPEIRNELNPREVHIDGTPDGGYALRILEYYRLRCNEKWVVEGFKENEKLIYDLMNETQDKRAIELDQAIAKLRQKEVSRDEPI